MRVLITGGAGFLGSHLTDHLLSLGWQVLVIDNYSTGCPENLTPDSSLTIVEGNIADTELVNRLFDEFKPDHVIHAAASYKDPDNWGEDIRTNVLGTIYVVQASQRVQVKRFIYLQTALCYGRPKEHPITISHPLSPFTSYSVTKTAGENYVKISGLSYVSLRLANIYGPRHLSGPMPTFYKRLKENKPCYIVDTRRDFFEIGDFLNLIDIVLMESDKTGCYNVSSGRDHTIKDIFDKIVERMGIMPEHPADVRPPDDDDVASLLLDLSETEKTFGWRAAVTLDEGIDRLVRWYDTNGVDEAFTHLRLDKKD